MKSYYANGGKDQYENVKLILSKLHIFLLIKGNAF